MLVLAQDAAVAGAADSSPAAKPAAAAPAKSKADPAKAVDCERAWAALRIKKGSHRAFVRACVRHG